MILKGLLHLAAAGGLFAGALGLLRLHDAEHRLDYMALPAPDAVRTLSAGYENIVADALYLQFVHYFGKHLRDKQHYYNIAPTGRLITDLDPRFEGAYVMTTLALGDNDQIDDVEAIWAKGVAANPDAWMYAYQAGMSMFLFGKEPRHYLRAAVFFRQAAAMPGAPPEARYMEARMFDVANRRGMAADVWRRIYLGSPSPESRAVAARSLRKLGVPLPRTAP